MDEFNLYYSEKIQSVDITTLRMGCLKTLFNVRGNGLIGFINSHHVPTLTFICRHRCATDTLYYLSTIFLLTISTCYPPLFAVRDQTLLVDGSPVSRSSHHVSSQYGLFAHDIMLLPTRAPNTIRDTDVAHLPIETKEFSITVMDQFYLFLKEGHPHA